MKKISLIPIGSSLSSIAFLPLLAAKCVDTNSQSKENTKQSIHSVIKTTELGELPRKDLDSIKSALSVKNPNLKIDELTFKIDEKENKVIVKANENSTLYTGEIVINYSIKSQNELAPGLDNKTYFESKLKELTEKISNAKKDVQSTVDINSGAKINKEKFNMIYYGVTIKMEEYSKEISNLEKSLEIFDEKVRTRSFKFIIEIKQYV
nr:variable surface lipoprotein [Mycoplasmopsis bovis]